MEIKFEYNHYKRVTKSLLAYYFIIVCFSLYYASAVYFMSKNANHNVFSVQNLDPLLSFAFAVCVFHIKIRTIALKMASAYVAVDFGLGVPLTYPDARMTISGAFMTDPLAPKTVSRVERPFRLCPRLIGLGHFH